MLLGSSCTTTDDAPTDLTLTKDNILGKLETHWRHQRERSSFQASCIADFFVRSAQALSQRRCVEHTRISSALLHDEVRTTLELAWPAEEANYEIAE